VENHLLLTMTESLSLQLGRHSRIKVDEPLLDNVEAATEVCVRDKHPRGGEGMHAAREELHKHDARVGVAAETELATEAGAWARWVPDVDTEFLRCGYRIDGMLWYLGFKFDGRQ
jgi:hypothetical protein